MTQFKKSFLWNAFGNIIYLGVQWLITVLVTRFYGYNDAGILSLAMSITAVFQTIALFGIRNYQVSDVISKYSESCYVMLRNITCIAALSLCMLFAFINHYSLEQILAVLWFMVFRLAENYSDVIHGIAQKENRLDIAGKGFALKGIVAFAVFLLGYSFGLALNICLMLIAVSSWLTTLLFDLTMTRRIKKFGLICEIGRCFVLGKETLPLGIYLFLSSAVAAAPKYILEKMSDQATLGAYSSIFAPAVILQAAATYIYTPFIGKFADLYNQNRYKGFMLLAAEILAVLLVICVLAISAAVIVGDYMLELVFGQSILAYSHLLPLTIVATFCVAVMSFISMLEVVLRDFKNLIIGSGIGLICSVAFTFIAIKVFGANGTSMGMIIGAVICTIYMVCSILFRIRRSENV